MGGLYPENIFKNILIKIKNFMPLTLNEIVSGWSTAKLYSGSIGFNQALCQLLALLQDEDRYSVFCVEW